MSTVDRATLIEAGARAIGDPDDFSFAGERDGRAEGCRTLAEDILDAVLPLIADALAMSRIEMYDEAPPGIVTYDFAVNVKSKAARLVRSLLSTDSDR